MRRLLTVPCRESTRGVFKGWSFRHVIMRQWHCSGHQTGPPAAFWFLPCHTLPSIAGKVPLQAAFVSSFITEFAYVLLTHFTWSWRNYLFWVADTELKAQPSSKAPVSLWAFCIFLFYFIGFCFHWLFKSDFKAELKRKNKIAPYLKNPKP